MYYAYQNLLSAIEMEKIEDNVYKILEKIGLIVENDELLEAAAKAGAKVDKEKQKILFPRELAKELLGAISAMWQERNKNGKVMPIEFQHEMKMILGNYPMFFVDWPERSQHTATRQDFIDMIHLGNAMPEIASISAPLTIGDLEPEIEVIEASALMGLHSEKPVGCCDVYDVKQIPYLCEITQIIEGHDRGYFHKIRDLTSPLKLGEHAAAILVEQLKRGWYSSIGCMPVAGVNAPMSMAGTVSQGLAEALGGLMVIRMYRDDIPGHCSIYSGGLDMKTACATFCSPEAHVQNIAAHTMLRDVFKIRSSSPSGYNTLAKRPGMQAVYEKMMNMLARSGIANCPWEHGILDSGRSFSPTQLMLDLEFNNGLATFFKGIEVNDNTLAFSVLEEVVNSEKKSFLEMEHTLNNFRTLWEPEFLDRRMDIPKPDTNLEVEMLDKADQKWRNILASCKGPEIDTEKETAVMAVIQRAKKDLIK
ncbi:MAG: hypothetical protein A2X48_12965 [Lentisphaerae bacterium GWF2_49_21]|nr:MAG: hypothetical protein A2X48_12965 [Lentisphaerae bacterium GWF2_49_21]